MPWINQGIFFSIPDTFKQKFDVKRATNQAGF